MRLAAAAAALLLAACAPAAAPPPPMDGEVRDDLMVLEPPAARPGEAVAITWPGGDARAIAYRMGSMASDGAWHAEYVLYTGQGAGGTWDPIGTDTEIPAMAAIGPGPDRLVIPDAVVPGDYRICTWDAPGMCVVVEVLAP